MQERVKRIMTVRAALPNDDAVDDRMIVEGYAAVFNSPTVLWRSSWSGITYMEQIDPNAFAETNMNDTIFNYNHGDTALILASAKSKTLTMETDAKGLKIRAEIADTSVGRDGFVAGDVIHEGRAICYGVVEIFGPVCRRLRGFNDGCCRFARIDVIGHVLAAFQCRFFFVQCSQFLFQCVKVDMLLCIVLECLSNFGFSLADFC